MSSYRLNAKSDTILVNFVNSFGSMEIYTLSTMGLTFELTSEKDARYRTALPSL